MRRARLPSSGGARPAGPALGTLPPPARPRVCLTGLRTLHHTGQSLCPPSSEPAHWVHTAAGFTDRMSLRCYLKRSTRGTADVASGLAKAAQTVLGGVPHSGQWGRQEVQKEDAFQKYLPKQQSQPAAETLPGDTADRAGLQACPHGVAVASSSLPTTKPNS